MLCNDCHTKATVPFHVYGFKCPNTACGGYNTREIQIKEIETFVPSEVRAAKSIAKSSRAVQTVAKCRFFFALALCIMNLTVCIVADGVMGCCRVTTTGKGWGKRRSMGCVRRKEDESKEG
eukprot:1775442-Rhodomonas_salina.1